MAKDEKKIDVTITHLLSQFYELCECQCRLFVYQSHLDSLQIGLDECHTTVSLILHNLIQSSVV